jgi:thiol-disulfide isomerase/thioredoxin
MKKIVLLLLAILTLQACKAQTNTKINLTFRDIKTTDRSEISFFLLKYELNGEKTQLDTIKIKNTNNVVFNIPENQEPAMFSLMMYANVNGKNQRSEFNILYGKEHTKLNTCWKTPLDSMKVTKGEETKKYFAVKHKKDFSTKYFQKLMETHSLTPNNDAFKPQIVEQLTLYNNKIGELYKQLKSDTANTEASKYWRWKQNAMILNLELQNQKEELKKNYLKRFNFSDPFIKQVNIINEIVTAYMFLFRDDNLSFAKKQEKIITGLDQLFLYLNVDKDILTNVAQKLNKEFKQVGAEDVMIHISENYLLPNACSDPEAEQKIRADVKNIKKLKPGNKAPNILFKEKDRKDLYSLNKKTIVLFWGTWCSHCQYSVPIMYKKLSNRKDIEVVAVALDNNKEVWKKEIKQFPNWMHIMAKDKFEDKIVKDFAIYATPTIYLLDKNGIIIKKSANFNELKL